MEADQLITMVVTAIITAGFGTITTVTALRVHINYLREGQQRNEQAITRAHNRIDELDKCAFNQSKMESLS